MCFSVLFTIKYFFVFFQELQKVEISKKKVKWTDEASGKERGKGNAEGRKGKGRGRKGGRVEEIKRGRGEEIKRGRDKEKKRGRDKERKSGRYKERKR